MAAGRVRGALLGSVALFGCGLVLAVSCAPEALPPVEEDNSCTGCSPGFSCPAAECCTNADCVQDGAGGSGGGGAGGSGGSGGPCLEACPQGTACNEETGTCVSTATCTPACAAGFDCQAGLCLPGAGAVGYPCSAPAECSSGECALSVTGEGTCVQACGTGCPPGTHCLAAPDRCVLDSFRECDGTLSCNSGVCTYWAMGTGYTAGCAGAAGSGRNLSPCTAPADCESSLCSELPPAGSAVCTVPCIDDFGCSGVGERCTSQLLDLGGAAPVTVQACAAPEDRGGTFGDCCASDADCDLSETTGCAAGADGVTMSCSSAAQCTIDDDCLFSLPVGVREGNCLNGVCVSATCYPR